MAAQTPGAAGNASCLHLGVTVAQVASQPPQAQCLLPSKQHHLFRTVQVAFFGDSVLESNEVTTHKSVFAVAVSSTKAEAVFLVAAALADRGIETSLNRPLCRRPGRPARIALQPLVTPVKQADKSPV